MAAREKRGIHAKLDIEEASDDQMDVASSEDEMEAEKEAVKVVAKVAPKRKAAKK